MKILISEQQIEKILLELKDTDHAAERLVERCFHGKLPVALKRTISLGHGQQREQLDKVGNYTFSDIEKNELKEKLLQIFSYDYNKKSYGVYLQSFDIINRRKNIEFYGKNAQDLVEKYMYQKGCGLYFVDFDEEKFDVYNREKYADSVAIIIRNNNAETIMWGRREKFTKEFFKTDYEIKKIPSLIQNATIRSAEVPERIQTILNVKSTSDEKEVNKISDKDGVEQEPQNNGEIGLPK